MADIDPAAILADAALFTKLRGWVKASLSAHAEWYKDAKEAFDFVAGRQWSEEDRVKLQSEMRPPVVFNLVAPTIDAICGMEVNNRQEVKYLPRTMGEVEANERLTSLGEWARDEAQAEDEESAAFRDNVICGRGWTETRIDFDADPMGRIIVDRIDPMEAGVDPAARKANFNDARYLFRYRDLDTDAAIEKFPGIPWQQLNAHWAQAIDVEDGGEGNKRDYPSETRSAIRDDRKPKTVRVVQVQWWEREPAFLVVTPDHPEPRIVGGPEWEQELALAAEQGVTEEMLPARGIRSQPVTRRVFKQAFLGGSAVLPDAEGQSSETIARFSLAAMTGKLDRNKGTHHGVTRALLDPARAVNKMLSQMLHILNSNAKGGLLYEKGVFTNIRKMEEDWSNPARNVEVNDGALSSKKIQERTAPAMPPALAQLLDFSMASIRNVTGVNLEILGAADREQAASLEYQRRQSAMSILAPLFDALRRYRKTQGHIMIACLRQLPPGVLVRVIADEDEGGDRKEAFQPFDPASFGLSDESEEYDVIVDEAPSSPNQKEQTWAALQPYAATLGNNPQAMAVLLKYSPLPSAAAKELTQAMSGDGIPDEVKQQIEQGKQLIESLQQRIAQLQTDQSIKAAAQDTNQFKAETDRISKTEQGDDNTVLLKLLDQRFEAEREERKGEFALLLQHLKNAGQIAASRVRGDATANPGIEMNDEVAA